ncbi:hypothetical protein BAE44_0018822 [Dichanthelium oligosanthes]|uniref:DUF4220 domain-containing protein n=1 Tax=Dichanthelium oligosanthes TaxID=888268 RepID=A0A1E5V4R9_9POAL|nr:hypothetical protein BAE44_0018822 [Dichanthelium oligosanthes]
MFDVWRVVGWWEDWQLRILVLGSLGLQWFLLLTAPMRKYTVPHIFRTCIWLAYISSDALAIYALATLFNRHARVSAAATVCGGGIVGVTESKHQSSLLEILWAPILLIHLGGQEELTAYEIEDNELWTRHTVTLVSQVAVALYAFYKSWPATSDWRLLAAAVLLFIIGVISFSEKPWALNRAKIDRLAAVSAWIQGTKSRSRWREPLNQFFLFEDTNCLTLLPNLSTGGENGTGGKKKPVALSEGDKVLMVLSDMSLLAAAKDLVDRGKADKVEDVLPPLPVAEKALPRWLRSAFAFIYTRATVVVTPQYLLYHLLVVPILHIAALTLFATSDKHPYKRADVKITYIVLCLTAALDFFAVFIRLLLYRVMSMTQVPALCETVPRYNLIDAALRESNRGTGWIYKCARNIGFNCNKEDYSVCNPQLGKLYKKVAGTVLVDLVDAKDRDLASYRVFTTDPAAGMEVPTSPMVEDDNRPSDHSGSSGNWALNTELQRQCGVEIRRSMRVSFDRSVLLWHIATDLCLRCIDIDLVADEEEGEGEQGSLGEEEEAEEEQGQEGAWGTQETINYMAQPRTISSRALRLQIKCTEAISNYMVHLLDLHPDMLLTGSRHHLISEAMDEIKSSFLSKGDHKVSLKISKELIYDIADGREKPELKPSKARHDPTRVFHIIKACRLAKELMEIRDVGTRWTVMFKVWLGMLCYSASMCRGYLHAKSLGEGGEFLSFVWLVLSLKGARTLADKLQLPEPQEFDNQIPIEKKASDNPESN